MSQKLCQKRREICIPRPEADFFCDDCTSEGYYQPVWGHPMTSSRYCRNPYTGEEIPGTRWQRQTGDTEHDEQRHQEICRVKQQEIIRASSPGLKLKVEPSRYARADAFWDQLIRDHVERIITQMEDDGQYSATEAASKIKRAVDQFVAGQWDLEKGLGGCPPLLYATGRCIPSQRI